jgi:hypothetical protein
MWSANLANVLLYRTFGATVEMYRFMLNSELTDRSVFWRSVMTTARATTSTRSLAQLFALASGAVFLLVGVLGFIPGVTTHYSDMSFAGHNSMAKLLGIFMVSVLHNIVHLLFGLAGVAAARTAVASRGYLIGGGVIYLVLWIYGLVIDRNSSANFVPLNTADNWLHLILGLGLIGMGVVAVMAAKRDDTADSTGTARLA